MGIGYQDTTDIPACKKMQGVYGSAVIGSGGQHTEPVKAVYKLSDSLSVASQIFRQLHIGSCDFTHLQGNLNALDFITGFNLHRIGHQLVQALLPVCGEFAFQKKIPLFGRKYGAIMYVLFLVVHSL